MDAKKISILSMIAASSCCLPPLILLGLTLIGVGTAGLAGFSSTLGALKWYIMPLAIIGLIVSYWLYFREKKKCVGTSCKMVNEKFTITMLTISTVVVIGFFSWSVYPYFIEETSSPSIGELSSAHFAVYQVDGMTCGGCEIAIDGAIHATGIVDSVQSSFIDSKTYIWYHDSITDLTKVETAIQSVGYKPILIESK